MTVIPGGDAYAAAINAIAATAPATALVAVTPSDSADLGMVARAIYIGGAGNIVLVARDDLTDVGTTLAVVAGQIIPVMTRRVRATNTTATGIVALY